MKFSADLFCVEQSEKRLGFWEHWERHIIEVREKLVCGAIKKYK